MFVTFHLLFSLSSVLQSLTEHLKEEENVMAREVNGLTTQTTSPSKPKIILSPKKFWMPKGYNFQGREEKGKKRGSEKTEGWWRRLKIKTESKTYFSLPRWRRRRTRDRERNERRNRAKYLSTEESLKQEKNISVQTPFHLLSLSLCLNLLRMYLKIAINKFVWHEFQSHPQWVLFPITFNLCHYILRDKFFSSFPLRLERHSFCFALVWKKTSIASSSSSSFFIDNFLLSLPFSSQPLFTSLPLLHLHLETFFAYPSLLLVHHPYPLPLNDWSPPPHFPSVSSSCFLTDCLWVWHEKLFEDSTRRCYPRSYILSWDTRISLWDKSLGRSVETDTQGRSFSLVSLYLTLKEKEDKKKEEEGRRRGGGEGKNKKPPAHTFVSHVLILSCSTSSSSLCFLFSSSSLIISLIISRVHRVREVIACPLFLPQIQQEDDTKRNALVLDTNHFTLHRFLFPFLSFESFSLGRLTGLSVLSRRRNLLRRC